MAIFYTLRASLHSLSNVSLRAPQIDDRLVKMRGPRRGASVTEQRVERHHCFAERPED
jgi:hypothetical protein